MKDFDPREHDEVALLLPWHVNGTLSDAANARVEAHLAQCDVCTRDVSRERLIRGRMQAIDTPVEYLPTASLHRFNARLDAAESTAAAARGEPRSDRAVLRTLAASVAAAACALGGWFAGRSEGPSGFFSSSTYRTVTTASARTPHEIIRAVFAPQVTLGDLQALLAQAELKIVAGPTEAGVYSLAATSSRPVDASLAILRRQAAVRFAERTDAVTTPRAKP